MPAGGGVIATTFMLTCLLLLLCSLAREGQASSIGVDSLGDNEREAVLLDVSEMTSGNLGSQCMVEPYYLVARIPLRMQRFDLSRQKADLVARVLRDLLADAGSELIESLVRNMVATDPNLKTARVLTRDGEKQKLTQANRTQREYTSTWDGILVNSTTKVPSLRSSPWYEDTDPADWNVTRFQKNTSNATFLGFWTYPYYLCSTGQWMMSYTVPMTIEWDEVFLPSRPRTKPPPTSAADLEPTHGDSKPRDAWMLSVDINISDLDINQCDPHFSASGDEKPLPLDQISYFLGTHKCHNTTSKCTFSPGHGWTRGGYHCECRPGFYARNRDAVFNGTLVEVAWKSRQDFGSKTYELLYECRPCARGCGSCVTGDPCLSPYNWSFRIALLTISVLCVLFTILLIGLVYHYRSVKVFKVASPIFLSICLIGCAIMYLEMAAIFPVLDTYACIATKWTRHLGFCITFSALLMKTWRVSLTYRVKSAHKIKLTDKQLLQWLTPMLLIMVIYLASWTISDPPEAEYVSDIYELKFKQCTYEWWDHALAMGEVLFLMWGVKVCFSVRKAESMFDEAKYISWAVYNIAGVNIFMVILHLYLFPKADPDMKFLFGFLRTQLSTSTTVALIFGPKFYRILNGTGDQYDNRARAKGVTASFSLNGLGVMNDEPADLLQENEELKEEIQKLAGQMEFMKIVHMEANNRHLKPKPGGYFSDKSAFMNTTTSQSPISKNASQISRIDGNSGFGVGGSAAATGGVGSDGGMAGGVGGLCGPSTAAGSSNIEITSSRLSPAAELVSERV
ncbi:putative G-protein coupled receptor CG31760 isoform X2 [Oratosquilla oratoria]